MADGYFARDQWLCHALPSDPAAAGSASSGPLAAETGTRFARRRRRGMFTASRNGWQRRDRRHNTRRNPLCALEPHRVRRRDVKLARNRRRRDDRWATGRTALRISRNGFHRDPLQIARTRGGARSALLPARVRAAALRAFAARCGHRQHRSQRGLKFRCGGAVCSPAR